MTSSQARTTRNARNNLTYTISCTLVMLVVMTSSTQSFKKRSLIDDSGRHWNTRDVRQALEALNAYRRKLHIPVKRSCSVGLQSHNCALDELANMMMSQQFLQSGYSPGKRSMDRVTGGQDGQDLTQDVMEEVNVPQDDEMERRKMTLTLENLLQALRNNDRNDFGDREEISKPKRSCKFRLGGHCMTSALDRAASKLHFLSSPNSPGRRRRSTRSETNLHEIARRQAEEAAKTIATR